nr:hypothetical protein [uncultured Flavobacterium sp.]
MKQCFFSICLFSSLFSFAQTTIIEEKKDKENNVINFNLLSNSNQIVISKGKTIKGLAVYSVFNDVSSYDINGIKKPLITDKMLIGSIFSNSENAILTTDISSGLFKSKTMYFIDGKFIELGKSELNDSNIVSYDQNQNFTSKFEYNLRNKKEKFDIDLEKDDVYLSVKDIFTRTKQTYKIDKPNLDKLIGPNLIRVKEKLGFQLRVNYDETIDLVTKSISKDYTNTILYKTRLSDDGKKVNDVIFDLNIPNHVFLYSCNDGGKLRSANSNNFRSFGDKLVISSLMFFEDDLSINNYIVDVKTGDIYIYGLYGDEFGNLNNSAKPKGYYVFKFDKTGKKLWESINIIEDSDFNKNHLMTTVLVDLVQLNENVCFTIRVNGSKDFFNYSMISKTSGKVTKSQILEFDDTNKNSFSINSIFKNLKEFRNKEFDFNTVLVINSNPKVEEYIKNVKSNNDLYFKSSFSDKGVWLVESDKEYYKVTLFKD